MAQQKRSKLENELIVKEKWGLFNLPQGKSRKPTIFYINYYDNRIVTGNYGVLKIWKEGFYPFKIENKFDAIDKDGNLVEIKGPEKKGVFSEPAKCSDKKAFKRLKRAMTVEEWNELLRIGYERILENTDPNYIGRNSGSIGIYDPHRFYPIEDVQFEWVLQENQNLGPKSENVTGYRIGLHYRKI